MCFQLLQIIRKLNEERMNAKTNFQGLSCFSNGLKVVPIKSIPGVVNAGWIPSARTTKNNSVIKETNNYLELCEALKKVLDFVSFIMHIFFFNIW